MLKETNKKYVTVYTEDEANIAYKIGDATYETSGWHDDFNGFTYDDCPFWGRGGFYNDGSAHAGGVMVEDILDGKARGTIHFVCVWQ